VLTFSFIITAIDDNGMATIHNRKKEILGRLSNEG
jgi:hypothetical protein